MSDSADEILRAALRLPVDQRADVAAELLRSLDADETALSPVEVERLWTAEIARRAERARSGESVGSDAEQTLRAIEAKLRR